MKIQAFIIFSLVLAVAATPDFILRRVINNLTVERPRNRCQSGSAIGLDGLMTQGDNLLSNILANGEPIRAAGVAGGMNDLNNLQNRLGSIKTVLTTLLGDSGLTNGEISTNMVLLSSMFNQTMSDLDNLLGPGMGEMYACTNTSGKRSFQNHRGLTTGPLTGLSDTDLNSMRPELHQFLNRINSSSRFFV